MNEPCANLMARALADGSALVTMDVAGRQSVKLTLPVCRILDKISNHSLPPFWWPAMYRSNRTGYKEISRKEAD